MICNLCDFDRREILQETAPYLTDSVCAYRAGYVAEDRRKIEREFFSGRLCGIAATNALELGIDVGHIDATLHLGFPGSIASLWQQAGRSGRRDRESLAVYVAFEGPLDQYFIKFPKKLFGGPIECCHIDAQNQQVLEQHLICAALEHPLSLLYDEKYFGSSLKDVVMSLKHKGYLSSDPSRNSSDRIWSYIGHEKVPSRGISIRAIESVRYSVVNMKQHELLEEIEESRAFFQVYEGAVYMHQGKTYLVKELNISEKIALCHKTDVDYYTKTRDYTDIHVLGGDIANPARVSMNQSARTTAQANSCRVTTTWFGFYCIQRRSNKVLDTVELSLPKYSYESQAVWIQVPQSIKKLVEKNFSFRRGLHAASHAVLNVVPLYIRCNSSDLAPECPNPHDTRYYPERILVYDQHPGGTGVSKQIQPFFTKLLNAALELLTSCHCFGDVGCPNCVQSLVCHEYNEEIHKDAAIMIIKGVLDAEKSYFEEVHDSYQKP
uniref:Putative ATP-dependent helicase hrq1 isoform X3 n=1 Tax=Rhizophora mucronata TaxID=61149 RepID=A0A2P2M9Z9_RHIMU